MGETAIKYSIEKLNEAMLKLDSIDMYTLHDDKSRKLYQRKIHEAYNIISDLKDNFEEVIGGEDE